MKILVIGGGGREHALCWRFQREGHEVFALPGSAGIAEVALCVEGRVDKLETIVDSARKHAVDLVVIGPEVPLVQGLADMLRAEGIRVFGPGAEGAQLEGSKIYSKVFFEKHGIRSAEFVECSSIEEANRALERLGPRVVVKADGLAAGKGVVVCGSKEEAIAAASSMLVDKRFGDAGAKILIEQRLEGRELSLMAICDGHRYEILAGAEDHKAIFDGDVGPNTGGMGTVSPVSWVDDELLSRIRKEIFDPTLAGLRSENIDFRGVLYAGLMVTGDGVPWLLEYNVRFGDPETQPVLRRLQGNLGERLRAAADGNLPDSDMEWDARTAVCVVLSSCGYPESSSHGDVITGINSNDSGDIVTFHAGTKRNGEKLVTAGGRVLAVTALGSSVESARTRVYEAVSNIEFSGMHYRRDIGVRRKKGE